MGEIPFLNISAISQHDRNPELELANPGIIEKVTPLCGIKKSCGGVDLMAFICQLIVFGRFRPRIVDTPRDRVLTAESLISAAPHGQKGIPSLKELSQIALW